MIGYHYTTWEAYQKIKKGGLQLSPLEDRHRETCWEVVEFVKDGCIWVYPEFMQGYELIGMIFYVAFRHNSHRTVCLKVDYAEWESASRLAKKEYEAEEVRLTHNLDAGPFGHFRKHFDLVTQPVEPEFVQLVGSWDIQKFADAGVITRARMVA